MAFLGCALARARRSVVRTSRQGSRNARKTRGARSRLSPPVPPCLSPALAIRYHPHCCQSRAAKTGLKKNGHSGPL